MLWPSVRQRWYRLLGVGPLVMLLALAPGLLYPDHWTEFLGWANPTEEEPIEHAGHCHLGPASCSEQPVQLDIRAVPAVVDLVEPELTSVLLEERAATPAEHVVTPPTEPPRA